MIKPCLRLINAFYYRSSFTSAVIYVQHRRIKFFFNNFSADCQDKIMPSIAGKYQHYKNEDVDDYFTAVGVPFMGRKMMAMSSPLMEITVDGENMIIKNSSLLRTVEMKYKLGEEYEERMPSTTIKSITTLVNDNELVTQSVIPETGDKCGRHYMFTDDECIITLTHEKAKTPGKRYFRRVKS